MAGYRTKETSDKLKAKERLELPFSFHSLEKIREFKYWYIVENQYPYDRVAKVSHILVPKRVFADLEEMEFEEWDELHSIKAELGMSEDYDSIIENMPHERSVRHHYHLHLVKLLTD
jgi:diadenosine tetraphosphate (Ap4A) HIT family hydrolase